MAGEASWVTEATTPKEPGPTGGYGYGYLWWIAPIANHQPYSAFGLYGQMIMVVPISNWSSP